MNYQEILEVLRKNIDSFEDFAYEEYESDDFVPNLGEIVEIEQVGGEGKGDHWHSVKHFVEHDMYIKVTGWYSSYNGTDFDGGWDCCKEVKPV